MCPFIEQGVGKRIAILQVTDKILPHTELMIVFNGKKSKIAVRYIMSFPAGA